MINKKTLVEYFIAIVIGIVILCLIAGVIGIIKIIDRSIKQAEGNLSWKLLIHPTVGEPVELSFYQTNEACESDRQDQIRKAVLQGRAIPALTCTSHVSLWQQVLKNLFQAK